MPVSISLGQSQVVAGSNNSVFTYNFPNSASFVQGDKIALQNLALYYSWTNISSTYGNNTFSYIWTGSSTTTTAVVIPNGFYSIAQLNSYLQSRFFANGQYLIDASGNYVYYLEIVANSSLNSFQINSYPVPQTLPTGFTQPANWAGYSASASNSPQLIIPATNIQTLLGFATGTYPPAAQNTAYSATSTTTPQISPVTSVYMFCSLVRNNLSRPNLILYNFSPNVGYGSQIQITPPYLVYIPIQAGNYPSITVSFYDQNFNSLVVGDPNMTILLAIKLASEEI